MPWGGEPPVVKEVIEINDHSDESPTIPVTTEDGDTIVMIALNKQGATSDIEAVDGTADFYDVADISQPAMPFTAHHIDIQALVNCQGVTEIAVGVSAPKPVRLCLLIVGGINSEDPVYDNSTEQTSEEGSISDTIEASQNSLVVVGISIQDDQPIVPEEENWTEACAPLFANDLKTATYYDALAKSEGDVSFSTDTGGQNTIMAMATFNPSFAPLPTPTPDTNTSSSDILKSTPDE